MRIRKALTYAVLTALAFPLVLLTSFTVLYTLSDERWYHGDEANISSQEAIRIAQEKCFQDQISPSEALDAPRARLVEKMKWLVTLGWSGWYKLGLRNYGAIALIDAKDGRLLNCSTFAK